MVRLRELDFLRGVAIILVLMRHIPLFTFTTNMGWIGVDLFFVLSGFLVSGLLFKEYIRFGNIKPKLFLIRRGFKIYPIYYIFYLIYLAPILIGNRFDIVGFMADMTFTQNYVWGWGYAYNASWSLAVEEHFYFAFALFLWLGIKYKTLILKKLANIQVKRSAFEFIVVSILVICLIFRYISNIMLPTDFTRNITMTHLRIDSLLCGVWISYLYYFKNETLNQFFRDKKYLLYTGAILGISWTPFIDSEPSFFVKTIGFTLVYLSFGILLLSFLLEKNINLNLDKMLSASVVNTISKIGFCSYSIYIIHLFMQAFLHKIIDRYHLYNNSYTFFIAASGLSIIAGMIMTHKIEKYFLRIRNKYYPARV
jgi:peptidoglycan/LPS O-acetylase OafA/YrhL